MRRTDVVRHFKEENHILILMKKFLKLISLLSALVFIIFWLERVYVRQYNGNHEIIFIEYTSIGNNDYLELFRLSELKDKYVFVTLNLSHDSPKYREDLLAMDALTERYKNSDIVFLHTVEIAMFACHIFNCKRQVYDWKKVIKQYNLRGYHIKLPGLYEERLCESSFDGEKTITRCPKYMIISDKGEIIDKWAPRPSKKEELTNMIDSLLNKKTTAQHGIANNSGAWW